MKGTVYSIDGSEPDVVKITVSFSRAEGPGDLADLHLSDAVILTPVSAEG